MAVKITVYGEAKLEQIERARSELNKLEAQARRSADGIAGSMTRIGEGMQRAGTAVTNTGTALTRNLTVPVVAATGVLALLAKGAEDAAIAQAKLDNVLDSMGYGDAAERVGAYAEQLERSLAIDADVIKATQTKLATFSNLTASVDDAGGAFDRATVAALDLAAAGFGSAESQATALGKALQDPIKGITALARSGVSFTESEQAKIRALVESNQLLAAQDMILSAIETQVGGTAEAGASSFERIRLQLAAIGDEIGTAVLPFIERFADILTNNIAPVVIPALQRVAAAFQNMSPGVQTAILAAVAFAAALGPVLVVVGTVMSTVGRLTAFLPRMGTGFLGVLGPIGLIIGALAALVASSPELRELLGNTLTNLMQQLGPVLSQVAEAFAPLIGILGGAFQQIITALVPVVGTLITALAGVLLTVVPILADLLTALAPVVAMLAGAFAEVIAALIPIIGQIITALTPVVEMLAGAFAQVLQAIIPIILQVVQALMPVVMVIAGALLGALQAVIDSGFIDMLIGLFMQVMDAVMPLIPLLLELITPLLGLIEPIGQLIGALLPPLVAFLGEAIPIAVEIVGGVLTFLIGIVVALVTAIVSFVVNAVKAIAKFAADVATNIGRAIDWFVSLPQKIGDALSGAARWLVDTGRDIVEGLLNGIKNAWTAVTSWVGDAIDGLLGGVKDLLGISSPSRVFATIGAQMGEGMRVGLDSTLSAVEQAAQKVAAAAVVSASGTVQLGMDAAAAGFPVAPLGGGLSPSVTGGASVQFAAGAIQITIQGNASRDDVRGGVEDALASLLTEIRSR